MKKDSEEDNKLNEILTNGITEQVVYSKTPFVIVLNGGGTGGSRNECGEAHFHVFINPTEEYKIKIPVKKLSDITIDDLLEIEESHPLSNEIKEKLLEFLLSGSEISVNEKTNLEEMATLWNGINKFNSSANLIPKEELKKYRGINEV